MIGDVGEGHHAVEGLAMLVGDVGPSAGHDEGEGPEDTLAGVESGIEAGGGAVLAEFGGAEDVGGESLVDALEVRTQVLRAGAGLLVERGTARRFLCP